MSRLYDALSALERKRPGVTASGVPPFAAEPRASRSWPTITVVVVALCGMATATVLRDRSTAPVPVPGVDRAAEAPTMVGKDLRERAREAAAFDLVDEAEMLLQQAVKQAPADAIAWNDLGVVLARRAQLTRAIEALRLSIALDPKYAMAHRNLAVALEGSGRRLDAAAHYRLFIALAKDEAERSLVEQRLVDLQRSTPLARKE